MVINYVIMVAIHKINHKYKSRAKRHWLSSILGDESNFAGTQEGEPVGIVLWAQLTSVTSSWVALLI